MHSSDTQTLSVERLFADPPLTQGAPADLRFAPDGRITYLRAADDDRERLDLWCIVDGQHHLLLDARSITATDSDATNLTAAERAERERRRQFHHGITQYHWHPDGQQLLIPMDGQAYLVDPDHPATARALCPEGTRQSAFTMSPGGTFLSYVRDGNLYVSDIGSDQAAQIRETQLTDDASETVSNGLADFLAAEEMHRFDGHWWSKDDRYIAYTRVDEAPVTPSFRLELDAAGARTVTQRYPYPGQPNPSVQLFLFDRNSGQHTCVWSSDQHTPYLARVAWLHQQLIIQVQNRLQQELHYLRYKQENDTWETLYTDRSDTWINLTDDLTALTDERFLLSHEAYGPRQLLILDQQNGFPLQGPTHINHVHAVDDQAAYVSGWDQTPVENHLYRVPLDGSKASRLTQPSGWHDVTVDVKSRQYLDRYTHTTHPVKLKLASLDGAHQLSLFEEQFDEGHAYQPYLAAHCRAEFGQIEAADGQALYYRMTPPLGARDNATGQWPVLVYVYGGPGAQKVKQEWSPLLVQLFAHHGFGVLELDNRGSTNRGRRFEAPLYRNMGSVEIADQRLAPQIAAEFAWADATRMGVFGHSYGGYMTLMCLSQAADVFKAGVAVAPVCDWQLYDTHYTERFMGLPADNAAGYAQGHVLTHLHKLDAPLLLMHGMADDNVLFTHSTLIMDELQRLGKPFELMTYPGAKHSMQEQHVSVHRFTLILDFLHRTLGVVAA